MLSCAASSLATNRRVPSLLTATCSGSVPAGTIATSLPWRRSMTPMPSAFRSGGGSLLSSTPGPAIGEPLRATYRREPSGLAWMPLGRFPNGIVATTAPAFVSMTLKVPARSLVT